MTLAATAAHLASVMDGVHDTMVFPVILVRPVTDPSTDDRLFPVLSGGSDVLVATAPLDGEVVATLAKSVEIHRRTQGELAARGFARNVKIDPYVTDARVALACRKYDKGSRWVGYNALWLNAASRVLAAVRRHGKVLVGQVRYPWLVAVGFTAKTGWLSEERLRLQVIDKDADAGKLVLVDLTLPKGMDAGLLAQQVVQRAARYRLAHDRTVTAEVHARFEELSQAPRLSPVPKEYAMYVMPTHHVVSAASAVPGVEAQGH